MQLYEEYPVPLQRRREPPHRWIRGDWQLARWLLPARSRAATGGREKNPLSALSRWKIFDNLRRSLVARGADAAAAAGLDGPVAGRGSGPCRCSASSWFPSLSASLVELLRKPDDVLLRQHLARDRALGRPALRAGGVRARLPAVRGLLQPGRDRAHRPCGCWSRAGGCSSGIASSELASATARTTCRVLPVDVDRPRPSPLPRCLSGDIDGRQRWRWRRRSCCCGSPRPPSRGGSAGRWLRREARLTAEQTLFLRTLARKTWAFFETFVGAEDHWLPPDNFQEHPAAAVAHRTSPTNMGLALLANLSAYDFGYISAGTARRAHGATRSRTMDALERLPRALLQLVRHAVAAAAAAALRLDGGQRKPRRPSADACGPGLLALADDKILARALFDGLSDTLGILMDAAAGARTAAAAALQQGSRVRAALPGQPRSQPRGMCHRSAGSAAAELAGSSRRLR